jgi:hypothetical protein
MKRLKIDRSQWLRGETEDNSCLLRNGDKKMCCLGFLALQCGYTPADILDKENPAGVDSTSMFPTSIVKSNLDTPICKRLMVINDDVNLDEPTRELELKRLFKKAGYLAQFID